MPPAENQVVAQARRSMLPDAAEKALQDLKSRHEAVKTKAQQELRAVVEIEARRISGEEFSGFITELNKRIFDLVKSEDPSEKLGGIYAMDTLVDVECEESSTFITRFANYLRLLLPCSHVATMIMASRVMGHLAQAGGTLTADFVEFEVKRALEGLNSEKRVEQQRLAGVLVLKQLALNAPTLFFMHVPPFIKAIWVPLRDSKQIIREGAIEALRACLALIAMRDGNVRKRWFTAVFQEAERGLRSGSTDSIHGSLLVVGELLRLPPNSLATAIEGGMSVVYDILIRFKDHRAAIIRKTVISILPVVASLDTELFRGSYAEQAFHHLTYALQRQTSELPSSFEALASLIRCADAELIRPWTEQILHLVQEGITPRPRKPFCTEAITCLSSLAGADPHNSTLQEQVMEMLDQIFAGGEGRLAPVLIKALSDIGSCMPLLMPDIQMKLLDAISFTLQRTPYQLSGTPNSRRIAPLRMSAPASDSGSDAATDRNAAVIEALNALAGFDFAGNQLSEFIRDCLAKYLDDPQPSVRLTAAQTCSKLLLRPGTTVPKRSVSAVVVCQVLDQLLGTAVGDPEPHIRLAVLQSLGPRFDYFLSRADSIRSLFVAVNDENFAVREAAMERLSRLTLRNPSHVMPPMRKLLVQLLTSLDLGGEDKREKSSLLLGHVIRASHHLIKPYVTPVLHSILPKLRDPNPNVAANVLKTVGVLSRVGGAELVKFKDEIFPLMMEALQDQRSSTKRRVATRTLGLLVQHTGTVIQPYQSYPELLDIMLSRMKTESAPDIRLEHIKVLGILGAMDPHRLRAKVSEPRMAMLGVDKGKAEEGLPGPSSDDYYPTVAVTKLVKILKDQSLSSYHNMVIQALMFIFKTLGLKCVTLLPQIMHPILALVKSSQHGLRDFLFQQLGTLVAIVKQHIRPYLGRMFELMHEFWSHQALQAQILFLIGEITIALKDEFKDYISALIPKMLTVLQTASSASTNTAVKVLHVLELFDANLELYLHVTVPSVTMLIEQDSAKIEVRTAAILWIARMCRKLNLSDYASRILHPLARVLRDSKAQGAVQRTCMTAVCALLHAFKSDMLLFQPLVSKAMERHKASYPDTYARYETLLDKVRRREALALDDALGDDQLGGPGGEAADSLQTDAAGRGQRINVNQPNLKRAWEASHRSTKEDWSDWLRRFSVELLRESPSPALRSCAALAQVYHPLASELFNAAFVSCWSELYEQYRESLMRNLEIAFSSDRSPNVPPEVLQTLLALAEFMEHDEKPLPIDIRKLGAVAEKCQAYAKSLHYKEAEFLSSPATSIQSLISINNYLNLPEAANGLLVHAQKTLKMELKESWYEKLHRWEEALAAYRERDEQEASIEAKEGCMRCLEALGEWESLQRLADQTWAVADADAQKRIAPLAAVAALQVGQLGEMGAYVEAMDPKTVEGSLYRSILLVHNNQFEKAQGLITETRKLLDTQVTALVGESYERAYNAIVKTQQVAELEEVLNYKKAAHDPASGGQELLKLRSMWNKRLFAVQANGEVWQRIMAMHSLVLPPEQNEVAWLKYAALCRKTHRLNLCHRTLVKLIQLGDTTGALSPFAPSISPRVSLAWLKYLWATGQRDHALASLQDFVSCSRGDRALQARSHLKVGLWVQELHQTAGEALFSVILSAYRNATVLDKDWYKAWHHYALFNFQVITYYEGQVGAVVSRDRLAVAPYLVPAVNGFFRSIALQKGHVQQDILRLLTLWFKYGAWPEVESALAEGFRTLPIDTWLEVIPQIIARINTPNSRIRASIHELLVRIGKEHPQALVYPLTVASKSHSADRRQQAETIFQHLQTVAPVLTQQSKLVSEELIRVAILWHEMWHEALEEASRLYFADHNVPGMLAVLKPMHDLMHKGPETKREISFQQQLGPELQEALEWCNKYEQSKQDKDLQHAWDLYYNVFRQITKTLPRMTHLELQLVSPNLLAARDLQLAIPGLYRPGQEVVSIRSVEDTLNVITSKQRPRKCTMVGSDGKKYTFLLKGHEDLRQDERVMQLFGLVNTLLINDRESSRRDLQIVRYNVIPLSPNSGLIEWVPACDTLHALVRDYRESRKILLNIEHRLMLAMAPDYDNLPLMGKVEVFQHALANTTGQDLNKVLWLKSTNSEDWLVRRTNYTRSLGLMSMVGYVLGLGDRHPSNLMLHRHTGKIVHIDFGDCFEVAMQREKFPEKIPFRLTRMLTNAMEVCGHEGTFRFTCDNVMRVLRDNKGSVMAMLEAFVHDPLINWRLLGGPETKTKASTNNPSAAIDHGHLSHAAQMMSGAHNLDAGAASSMYSSQGEYDHSLDDPPMPTFPASVRPKYGSMHVSRLEAQLETANDQDNAAEVLNERAVKVISRVQNKLTGRDFDPDQVLGVAEQVDKLINQATSRENLCQCYVGWCPFW